MNVYILTVFTGWCLFSFVLSLFSPPDRIVGNNFSSFLRTCVFLLSVPATEQEHKHLSTTGNAAMFLSSSSPRVQTKDRERTPAGPGLGPRAFPQGSIVFVSVCKTNTRGGMVGSPCCAFLTGLFRAVIQARSQRPLSQPTTLDHAVPT